MEKLNFFTAKNKKIVISENIKEIGKLCFYSFDDFFEIFFHAELVVTPGIFEFSRQKL